MRCREEELAEAKTGTGGQAQGRDERAVWMAHAETAVASPARRALWSDSQFHILEMQTGTPHRSPATRSSSKAVCDLASPHTSSTPRMQGNITACAVRQGRLLCCQAGTCASQI